MGKQSREKWENREIAANGNEAAAESKTGLEKTCVFIIRWGVYASLFVPLIVMTQFFFPFVAPKTAIFRILVEIIFTAYLFLAVSNRKYRPRLDALTMSLSAFLAIFILASFTGINLSRSFWSTYERMTGIFTMLHLYAFFIILKSVFKKREDWEKFLGASIIAGVFLSIYVLRGSELSTRGGGTIGNSSFLAAYLIFDVFFAVILLLSKRSYWRIFAGASLIPMLWVFLTSTARGAIAAFFIGLFLLFLGCLFFSGRKILKRIAVSLVLLSVLFAVFLGITQPAPIKKEIKATLNEMGSRLVVWDTGLKGFLERPILGWGPENFNTVFQRKFNPCMSLPECGNEVWFDRVHNIVFDTLVTTGVAGLAAYLSIFLIVIYGLLRTIPKIAIAKRRDIFLPLGIVVLSTAYFLQNLMVFDMINSYLVFFLILAFAGFLIRKESNIEIAEIRFKTINPILASAIIILMVFIAWFGNIKPLVASNYIIKMATSENTQEFSYFFQKSLNTLMEKYETREQADQKLIMTSNQLSDLSPEDKEIFSKIYRDVEVEMEKSVQENYLDFRHHLFLGELYLASYRVSGNQDKLEKAEAILTKAIQLSPNNQQGFWQIADVKLAQRKPEEAIPFLKKATELHPRVGRAYWYLALGYKIVGQYEAALNEVYKAEVSGYDWRLSSENTQKVIEIYRMLGKDPVLINEDSKKVIESVLNDLETNPKDIGGWVALATAYANDGQYNKAREAAQKIIEISPNMAPVVEGFLKSIPNNE